MGGEKNKQTAKPQAGVTVVVANDKAKILSVRSAVILTIRERQNFKK